jgi:hypothetical protein
MAVWRKLGSWIPARNEPDRPSLADQVDWVTSAQMDADHLLDTGQPMHSGHVQIQQDHVEHPLRQKVQSIVQRHNHGDLEPTYGLEGCGDGQGQKRVVVGDQDIHGSLLGGRQEEAIVTMMKLYGGMHIAMSRLGLKPQNSEPYARSAQPSKAR